jgi:hypothetical protein
VHGSKNEWFWAKPQAGAMLIFGGKSTPDSKYLKIRESMTFCIFYSLILKKPNGLCQLITAIRPTNPTNSTRINHRPQ